VRALLTVVVAALAAFGARSFALARGSRPPASVEAPAAGLVDGVAALRAENERLARELERRSAALPAAAAPEGLAGIDEAEIAAALARWRAAHPEAEEPASPGTGPGRGRAAPAPGKLDLSSVSMDEIVRALSGNRFDDQHQQEIFEELRSSGRIDEYVAAIEALAAADPENAELQVALGHAYLQKLFGMDNSPELGEVAMKSDAAFDRALAIDDENWNARFSKAVSLSNWPAFLGRGPEAIEHFELLIEQQEGKPLQPEFAMPYLFLGNMHQGAGHMDKALAAWKAGLALFPEFEQLRNAVELAEAK
jgi:tetratricopeptide (TPR) repeat protein